MKFAYQTWGFSRINIVTKLVEVENCEHLNIYIDRTLNFFTHPNTIIV